MPKKMETAMPSTLNEHFANSNKIRAFFHKYINYKSKVIVIAGHFRKKSYAEVCRLTEKQYLLTSVFFQVREWELQFSEKYDLVGKLIKPGEEPTFYSDASNSSDEDEDKKTQ